MHNQRRGDIAYSPLFVMIGMCPTCFSPYLTPIWSSDFKKSPMIIQTCSPASIRIGYCEKVDVVSDTELIEDFGGLDGEEERYCNQENGREAG